MFKFYTTPTIDIVEKLIGDTATIKLSSAFNLNDPFELKFNLDIDPTNDGHEELFYKSNPNGTKKDFEDWQKHAEEHDGYTWYAEQQQRSSVALNIALCSFTESNKNNLMWSHYTDNHKGICIEYKAELFEYLKTVNDFLLSGSINYSDDPPVIKGMEDIESKVQKIMLNKQTEWKYEKEYRVVFFSKKDTTFLPINPNMIKAVYLGSRLNKEIENKIINVCEHSKIEIYHGITLGKSYEVNFKKHKKGTFYTRAFWQ